jgi:hypothetical protein
MTQTASLQYASQRLLQLIYSARVHSSQLLLSALSPWVLEGQQAQVQAGQHGDIHVLQDAVILVAWQTHPEDDCVLGMNECVLFD